MKFIRNICIAFVIFVAFAFVAVNFAIETIPVGSVGVKTQNFGFLGMLKQGVTEKDHKPGWHLKVPFTQTWHEFDSTVQTLEMTRNPDFGSQSGRDDIRVKSADGYEVSIDVTLKFRIMDGKAHMLYQNAGSGGRYKTIVRDKTQKACQTILGQMQTEDFYNPVERRTKQDQVKKVLQESLKRNYVDVVDVLLKAVQFDPQYEKKIQAKKIADQEVQLNVSLEKTEKMRGKTRNIRKETEVKVSIIKSQLEAEIVQISNELALKKAQIKAKYDQIATELKADADLYSAEKLAKGQLLVKEAQAQGEKLRNSAMQGVGGGTIVALEAARNLKLKEITISSVDTDLLDVDAMANKLGASK